MGRSFCLFCLKIQRKAEIIKVGVGKCWRLLMRRLINAVFSAHVVYYFHFNLLK